MTIRHAIGGPRGRTFAAAAAALAVWLPSAAAAGPTQNTPPPGLPPGGSSTIAIDVDVSSGEVDDVSGALDDLLDNVLDQYGDLMDARESLTDANNDLETARAAITDTETLIDGLTTLSDDVIVGAFVSPPAMAGSETLASESLADLAHKQVLLDVRADGDAGVLDALADARSDLSDLRDDEADAEADAADARQGAQDRLGDLEQAAGQQTLFLSAVENRLERGSLEAESLADIDPELAGTLMDDRDDLLEALQAILDDQELAAALQALADAQAEAEAAEPEPEPQPEPQPVASEPTAPVTPPGDVGAPSGSLADVACPGGGSITVDSSLEANLSSLLAAASADGLNLCGGGYRDPQRQIELRQQNCGSSHYAIYEAPSSACSPPTARPGSSNHERGLAVDFQNCGTRSTACYQWLSGNAANYGLYNLPSEPWHWSTDGT